MANLFKNKRQVILIFISIFSLAAVFAGVLLIRNRQEMRVGAQGITLSLLGPSNTLYIGQNFDASVYIDTKGMSVTGADLHIKFDSNLLEVTSIELGDSLPVIFKDGIVVGDSAQIILGSNVVSPKNGTGILARVKFRAKAQGVAGVYFLNETAVAALGQDTNVADSLNGITFEIIDPTATTTATATATSIATATATSVATRTATATATSIATATATSMSTATATATSISSRIGDLNDDGYVNMVDIGIVIDNYDRNPIQNIRADVDNSGFVNIVDIGIVVDHYDL